MDEPQKKTYLVTFPIYGEVNIEVNAENAEEAVELARDDYENNGDYDVDYNIEGDADVQEIE